MSLPLADGLHHHLLANYPADRDYSAAGIEETDIPDSIRRVLLADLGKHIRADAGFVPTRWTDPLGPGVEEARKAFVEACLTNGRIAASDWTDALRRAVFLTVAYAVEPAATLASYVFEGGTAPLPPEQVRRRMGALATHEYLTDVPTQYWARKGITEVDPGALLRLLRRIDEEVAVDASSEELVEMAQPLFAFADFVPDEVGVPASMLRRFFLAKARTDLADLIARGDERLTEDDLRELLAASAPEDTEADESLESDAEPEDEAPEVLVEEDSEGEVEEVSEEADGEVEAPPPAIRREGLEPAEEPVEPLPPLDEPVTHIEESATEEPRARPDVAPLDSGSLEDSLHVEDATFAEEDESELPDEASERADPEAEEDHGDLPLWKRFAGAPSAPQAAAAPPTHEDDDDEVESDEPAPLWRRFASTTEKAEAQPPSRTSPNKQSSEASELSTLEKRVLGHSGERRPLYVNGLTGGDEAAYADVLRQLDRSSSWTEASQVIAREIFRKHGVNIYSEAAVSFTDAVESRFESGRP
ncbi:hypothetical protein BH23BAC4_BH23BAC4_14420 [soil metagenome]